MSGLAKPTIYKNAGWVGLKAGQNWQGQMVFNYLQLHTGVERAEMARVLEKYGYDVDRHIEQAMRVGKNFPIYRLEVMNRERLFYRHENHVAYYQNETGLALPPELIATFSKINRGVVEIGADVWQCLINESSAVLIGSRLERCVLQATVADGAHVSERGYLNGRVYYGRVANEPEFSRTGTY
jgi:hypothetical protein